LVKMRKRLQGLAVVLAFLFVFGSENVSAADVPANVDPAAYQAALEAQRIATENYYAMLAAQNATAAVAAQQAQYDQNMAAGQTAVSEEVVANLTEEATQVLPTDPVSQWFSDAGFVGNSISVGLSYYIKRQGAGYLGSPKMMVKGSYSFMNDSKGNANYRISYDGYNGAAKDVIAKSGVKKVFINMGTNDLWEGPQKAYKRYIDYIQGIQQANPGIKVFIEATTPVYAGHENNHLSNKNVDMFNQLIKGYCDLHPDMYYVDINTPLKDENGCLMKGLSTDSNVHLTNAAYKIWTDTLISYVRNGISAGTL